jgi:ppGpp synthetase/RelA/SpoT-type nucleotidyltranferase
MFHESILNAYDKLAPEIGGRVELSRQTVIELLREANIDVHSVEARGKERKSLIQKVSRPDKTYEVLEEITDIVGVRIITYFEDSIEQIAKLVEQKFKVRFHDSSDKRSEEQFGYRSVHYICEISNFVFELQLRTILQHAWAEIEHDLGYKVSDAIPESIRRRFSRVAALLEIADHEFVTIRKDIYDHEQTILKTVNEKSASVPLDLVSLELLAYAEEVQAIDKEISAFLGREMNDETFLPKYLLKMLKLAGYKDIQSIRNDLRNYRHNIMKVVPAYFDFTYREWGLRASNIPVVYRGYSLFFLSHLSVISSTILEENKITKLAQVYRELDYPDSEASAQRVATGLVETFRSII